MEEWREETRRVQGSLAEFESVFSEKLNFKALGYSFSLTVAVAITIH